MLYSYLPGLAFDVQYTTYVIMIYISITTPLKDFIHVTQSMSRGTQKSTNYRWLKSDGIVSFLSISLLAILLTQAARHLEVNESDSQQSPVRHF